MTARNITQSPPPVTDLRALEVFTEVPAGCRLHLIRDERHWPHLRPGEWAVIDVNDREFVSGELFQVAFKSGPVDQRVTIQWVVARRLQLGGRERPEGIWFCALNRPHSAADVERRLDAGQMHAADGPLKPEYLPEYITGRVVGVYGVAPPALPALPVAGRA